jgi:hypothetical protein
MSYRENRRLLGHSGRTREQDFRLAHGCTALFHI